MPTRREMLVETLERGHLTTKELAEQMEMKVRDVLDDLEHVRRSTGRRFHVEPASCEACGFTFRKRNRLSTPSRCPRCRSERIAGPWLSIRAL